MGKVTDKYSTMGQYYPDKGIVLGAWNAILLTELVLICQNKGAKEILCRVG